METTDDDMHCHYEELNERFKKMIVLGEGQRASAGPVLLTGRTIYELFATCVFDSSSLPRLYWSANIYDIDMHMSYPRNSRGFLDFKNVIRSKCWCNRIEQYIPELLTMYEDKTEQS